MARTVSDVALALQALVGPDDRSPVSVPALGIDYGRATTGASDLRGRRIAVSTDYGGVAPVEAEVAAAVRSAAKVFESLGCEVVDAAPDFRSLNEIIPGTRALGMALRYSDYIKTKRDQFSPRLRAQIEESMNVDLSTVAGAERKRTALWHEVRHFMERFDYMLTPTWGVHPFRIDVPFDSKINGKEVSNFFDCILFTYSISVLGLPAVSVPAGMSKQGLPIGVQIAGHRFAEFSILEAASTYEIARGPMPWPPSFGKQKINPMDPMFLGPGALQGWRAKTH